MSDDIEAKIFSFNYTDRTLPRLDVPYEVILTSRTSGAVVCRYGMRLSQDGSKEFYFHRLWHRDPPPIPAPPITPMAGAKPTRRGRS